MNEQKILASLLQDRQNFDKVEAYLEDADFGPDGKIILNEIKEFYETDSHAKTVDKEILNARLERRVPNAKAAKALQGIVNSLPDVSGANVVQELLDLKATNIGLELAVALGSGDRKKINDLLP